MPILAIINLYITLSATAGLAALNLAQFNLPSIAGIYQMDMEIQNWLAVGGMLASSTPAIALMLDTLCN
jgi:conjugal transfer mating pair stabilization protein TraG